METLSRLKPYHSLPFSPPKSIYPSPNPPRNCPSFNVIVSGPPCYQIYPRLRFFYSKHRSIRRRSTAVRSQIAAADAAADAAHPASEFQLGPRIRGACFYTATAVAAMLLIVVMAAAHPFVMLLDRHRRRAHHLVAKMWAALTIASLYKVEIEGTENLPSQDTAAVYVSNHQSFLDIYTLLTLGRSFKFISKTSIFVIPIVGWAMSMLGFIPLRRMDSRSQLDCLKRCMDLVKKGASVFFFPEGTRSKDGKLGAFKKGAFTVAVKTEAPVVPITLVGTGKLMPPGKEGIVNSGSVKVVIHKPIEGINADILCNEARNVIADTLLVHGNGVQHCE